MAEKVTVEHFDQVAVMRLTNPPRNFLGPLVRASIAEKIDELEDQAGVGAIILTGHPMGFSQGYNQVRPEHRNRWISLADVCLRIEECKKPVIACLTGSALGAGFELALSAHARVAQAGTRVGMTDIAMGVTPGAGGTQRLTRLVGAETALSLLLSGSVIEVSDERLGPVIDAVFPDAEESAIAFAKETIAKGQRPVKTRDRTDGFENPLAFQKAIRACRQALGPNSRPAQHAIIRAVENAQVLPFPAGRAMEEDLYQESLASEEAQGNLHLLLAQRRLVNLPEAALASPQEIKRLGIIGSGPVALSLVMAALETGVPTLLFERQDSAVQSAKERLSDLFTRRKIANGRRQNMMQQLTVTCDPALLIEADLLIDAVADNASTKQKLMQWLAGKVPAATVLVTHSATLPVDPTAAASGRAGQVVGFSLVPRTQRVRLAEILPGQNSSAAAVATLHALLQRMGVASVRCGSQGGSIGIRMLAALRDASDYLLDQGIHCGQVDQALVSFGKTDGVFAAMDKNGLQSELAKISRLNAPQRYALSHAKRLDRMIHEGRSGQAVGKGFYDWVEGKPVLRSSDAAGTKKMDQADILYLCLGAMMNEGARLLREGIALRPSDIDMVMVHNHGFPAWKGGVMNAADQIGLFTLQRVMAPHAQAAPRVFSEDPGISNLIRNGEGFAALNGTGAKARKISG